MERLLSNVGRYLPTLLIRADVGPSDQNSLIMMKKISVILPVYNEEGSLIELCEDIKNNLDTLTPSYEIIFVDDGSFDNSPSILQELQSKNLNRIRVVKLGRHSGKTAALIAGFKASLGEIIITMDADLQNSPADIPLFVEKINQGYDFVCGRRFKRKDDFLKILVSIIFNLFLRLLFKTKFHDANCGFKAFNKRAVAELDLDSEKQRFIPILLERRLFKTTEIKIPHFRRKFGKSKYPIFRLSALFDLLRIISQDVRS